MNLALWIFQRLWFAFVFISKPERLCAVGVCAMCGTPAPTIEPHQALSAIPDEFSMADHEGCVSRSDSQ
jgi:hypothetical protein